MIIADKLRKTNRAEYLLYLWQIEDILRAYQCNEDLVVKNIAEKFALDAPTQKRVNEWYINLCEMMRSEGKKEYGHLQICQNVLQELQELHNSLISSPNFPYYKEMYYKILPYIVELRSKNRQEGSIAENESELETCFDFMYGILMLRLQKKEITPETEKALKDISAFLGQLSDYYFKDKEEPLEF